MSADDDVYAPLVSSKLTQMSAGVSRKSREKDLVQALWNELDERSEFLGPHNETTLATAHKLAIAMWRANEVQGAVDILNQALICIESSFGKEHPMRTDVLCTLGQIMFEIQHLERARMIQQEVVESRVRQQGPNHPSSIAAKNDLAEVLLQLGQAQEGISLLRDTYRAAISHVGTTHVLTSALAWNHFVNYERCGDLEAARGVLINELSWLLAEEPCQLHPDQKAIRTVVAERLNWDDPPAAGM
jgi:hypothetical protein